MHVFSHELEAIPPFDFKLTVHNPAGWYWHNPLKVFGAGLNKDISKFYNAVENESILKQAMLNLYGMRQRFCVQIRTHP